MNKIIIVAAAAGAAVAAFLLAKKRSGRTEIQPAVNPGKVQKHLTSVFSRAKRNAQHIE
ncbi:MAG: hypothetical protein ABIN67_19530 [Ferruginibacter sp.]